MDGRNQNYSLRTYSYYLPPILRKEALNLVINIKILALIDGIPKHVRSRSSKLNFIIELIGISKTTDLRS